MQSEEQWRERARIMLEEEMPAVEEKDRAAWLAHQLRSAYEVGVKDGHKSGPAFSAGMSVGNQLNIEQLNDVLRSERAAIVEECIRRGAVELAEWITARGKSSKQV